ncbi:MAG: hypothetical protein Q9205_004172 [Flavoplaca limonia]
MIHSLSSRRGLARLRDVSYKPVLQFSTSTPNWKAPPRRSPTVQAIQGARQKGLPAPPPPSKWPLKLLESHVSHAEWAASLTLKDVTAILDDFEALGLAMAKMQAKAILSEYNIQVDALYYLGSSLLDWNDFKYRDVAITLLICALEYGNPGIAWFSAARLLNDAMLTGRQKGPGVAAARKVVRESALWQAPYAVYLEGKVLEYEGKLLEALQIYQTWSDSMTAYRKGPHFSRESVHTPEHGDICKALARLRARLGDRVGAEEAIRDAALVYDDPAAFYLLAVEFATPGSKEAESFLLKAASSDQPKASHELGLLYFNESRQGVPLTTPKTRRTVKGDKSTEKPTDPSVAAPIEQQLLKTSMPDKRAEAMEWFHVAAESGITASQVYLAILLRDVGRSEEGLEWLQKAAKSHDADEWNEGVEYFKQMWRRSDQDPVFMDIESLRKSSKNRKIKGTSTVASLKDATFVTDPWQNGQKMDGRWIWEQREMRNYDKRLEASWR